MDCHHYAEDEMSAIVPMPRALQMLAEAATPAETKRVEEISAAAKAWAREQHDYEGFVSAALVYILARRKTTELIRPNIVHGDHGRGNEDVTSLEDYGLTKMQWHRRMRELEIPMEGVQEYFDECISKGWYPSIFAMLRRAQGTQDGKRADVPDGEPETWEENKPKLLHALIACLLAEGVPQNVRVKVDDLLEELQRLAEAK